VASRVVHRRARDSNVDVDAARELIGLIDERIVEMLHTKDGAFVGWLAVTLGTAKVLSQCAIM
jgi:hypothetical protein